MLPELDYRPADGMFVFWLPREHVKSGELTPQILMNEHGFDMSLRASTSHMACLHTRDPYAAVTFLAYGTSAARQKLAALGDILESSRAKDAKITITCPADKELWPFQRANVAYARSRHNVLIADEPGLGKTPTAICIANEMKAKRVLVICPASIRLQWAARVRDWTTLPWPYTIHTVLNGKHGVHPTADWTIVSYDLARTEPFVAALGKQKFDLLILDEAHYLKSYDAKRTRTILGDKGLVHRTERVLALTGTPLPNRPREAYTIARALCWDAIDWASEDTFRDRFNPSLLRVRSDGRTWIDERTGRHAELQNRLRAHFMTRHLKADVMTQLKLPIYDLIQVQKTAAVKAALKAESLLQIDPENLTGADMTILGHVSVVRKEMGLALAPQVADYVDMLFAGGEEKLVLFGHHIEVLNILEKRLAKYGLIRVDGRTSAVQKERRILEFIQNPQIKLALGNLLSLGTGTDGLQHVCCHALIAEPSWTPGENVQGFDRLHRGGQQRTVQGEIFVAPGSFAEKILASALRKLRTTHKALDKIW